MTQSPLLSERLAAFAARTRFGDVPEAVRTRAKLLMLDAIGNAFASVRYPFAGTALSSFQDLGSGEATVIGMPGRLTVRDAVLMNATLVHGLDGLRHSFAPYYHEVPGMDMNYLHAWALGLVVLGLLLQVVFSRRMLAE
jgi:succinate dehydrogenase/fumarate reductase cytochrome b subunit